jgi:hypothetical protein
VRLTVRRLDADARAQLARAAAGAGGNGPVELQGARDGFLLAADGDPACWCRVSPNGGPDSLVLSDFRVAPIYRHRHFALKLLEGVVEELRAGGVHHVDITAERGDSLDHLELWDGPEDVFHEAGFELVRDDPVRPVLRRQL